MKASRLPSQSYIFFPLLLGQALAYWQQGSLSWQLFIKVHLFGLLIQLFIVYANDYADRELDKHNQTYNIFSGGSRVLVDGELTNRSMKKAIFLMITLNIMLGVALIFFYGREWSLLFIIVAMFLLWAYSYGPIKLSYRGGGELLQVIGVAGLLPLFAYYIQTGKIASFPWVIILMLLPNHLGCALSTGIPDYPSDKNGNKRTFSVLFGLKKAKVAVILLNFLSLFILLFVRIVSYPDKLLVVMIPLVMNLMMIYIFTDVEPGERKLFYFVMFNIINVICFTAGLALYFFIIAR